MGRKPIIVLVPGIWAGAGIWTRTVAKLHKHGYQTAVAPLVSPGRPYSATAGGPTVWDDVAAIRKVVSEAVNANGGSEVIVVMHAGGGIMGSMALKGLTRHSRKKEGLKGGVSKLAYIAALLWYLGMEWDHFDYSVSLSSSPGSSASLFADFQSRFSRFPRTARPDYCKLSQSASLALQRH